MQKFEYREQLNNRGCFVEFEFEIKFQEGLECGTECNYLAEPEWELPCRMGVRLFESYLFKFHTGKLSISINNVEWLPADTNDIIILFAMVKALDEYFNLGLTNLKLDTSEEVFKFPEPRQFIR